MICLSIMALIRILFCFFFCESTGNTLTLTSSGYLMRDIWLYNTSPICCGNGFAKSKIGCLSLSFYLDECLLLLYLFIVDFALRLFFARLISISRSFFRCLFRCHSQSMSSRFALIYCILFLCKHKHVKVDTRIPDPNFRFGSFRDRWNK